MPFSRRKPCTCLMRLTVVPRMELIRACMESKDAVADADADATAAASASASAAASGLPPPAVVPSLPRLSLWLRVALRTTFCAPLCTERRKLPMGSPDACLELLLAPSLNSRLRTPPSRSKDDLRILCTPPLKRPAAASTLPTCNRMQKGLATVCNRACDRM